MGLNSAPPRATVGEPNTIDGTTDEEDLLSELAWLAEEDADGVVVFVCVNVSVSVTVTVAKAT